jgi:hypothetical protein
MFAFPKLVLLILVLGAIWIVYRWVNGARRGVPRRDAAPPQRTLAAEDLVACGVCGAYVAVHAPACPRRGCPRPR